MTILLLHTLRFSVPVSQYTAKHFFMGNEMKFSEFQILDNVDFVLCRVEILLTFMHLFQIMFIWFEERKKNGHIDSNYYFCA